MLKRNLRIISLCLAIILAVQMSGILEISAQATSTSQDTTVATEEKPEIIGEIPQLLTIRTTAWYKQVLTMRRY